MKTRPSPYEGHAVTVTWDRARCIHVEACVHGLPAVFDKDRRPWIAPDAADADALAAVVLRCPTGALHLSDADGTSPETVPETNTVTVSPDGPLYLHGAVTVQDPAGEALLRDTRVALCRCGRSANKPLCDNAHLDGFTDPAHLSEVSRTSPGSLIPLGTGGLTVTPLPDGPLSVEGPFTVVGADGTTTTRMKAALCRCGASANKPFCDGSHRRIGFRTDDMPTPQPDPAA